MLLKNMVRNEDGSHDGEVEFPLLNQTIEVSIEDGVSMEFAKSCVQLLHQLSDRLIDELCEALIAYSDEFLTCIDEELIQFSHKRDVRQHIDPVVLIITPPTKSGEPFISMELNCDWEEEHGVQWIIQDDKVKYVGPYEGYRPDDTFEYVNYVK